MSVAVSSFIFLISLVIYIIVRSDKFANHHIEVSEPDNPLLLTIRAMENELTELHENNRHMERIQRLEEQIEEARRHADALAKVSKGFGSTVDEMLGSVEFTEKIDKDRGVLTVSPKPAIVGGVGSTKAYHYCSDNSVKVHEEFEELIDMLDESIYKSGYGKWNTIPQTLDSDERIRLANERINRQLRKQSAEVRLKHTEWRSN